MSSSFTHLEASIIEVEAARLEAKRVMYRGFHIFRAYIFILEWINNAHPETFTVFKGRSVLMGGIWLDDFAKS